MLAKQVSTDGGNDIKAVRPRRVSATRLFMVGFVSLLLLAAGRPAPTAAGRGLSPDKAPALPEEPDEVAITLRQEGFDLEEVVRPAGSFMLSVDNRSGVEKVTLILKRGNGSKVIEVKLFNGNGDWSELVELQPGRYTLTEADHPSWQCVFLVHEKK